MFGEFTALFTTVIRWIAFPHQTTAQQGPLLTIIWASSTVTVFRLFNQFCEKVKSDHNIKEGGKVQRSCTSDVQPLAITWYSSDSTAAIPNAKVYSEISAIQLHSTVKQLWIHPYLLSSRSFPKDIKTHVADAYNNKPVAAICWHPVTGVRAESKAKHLDALKTYEDGPSKRSVVAKIINFLTCGLCELTTSGS